LTISGVPEGFDAMLLAELAGQVTGRSILHICRDDSRMRVVTDLLGFFEPTLPILRFPAWDCLPYDRVSPKPSIVAQRMSALARLAGPGERPAIVLSTVNAVLQRVPPKTMVADNYFEAQVGGALEREALIGFLTSEGYLRTGQVMEAGEYAVRGGLLDIFSAGEAEPLRLDLFGDRLDGIRTFDPLTQRSTGRRDGFRLLPANEFVFEEAAIGRFRKGYHEHFGAVNEPDPLYEAVSEGRRHQGMEHWLPLFHEHMETLFDYLGDPLVILDYQFSEAVKARLDVIGDYYEARREARKLKTGLGPVYKPLPGSALYLSAEEIETQLSKATVRRLSPFHEPPSNRVIAMPARLGRDFAPERQARKGNIYEVLKSHAKDLEKAGKRVVMASYSGGARERLKTVLGDHGMATELATDWASAKALAAGRLGLVVLPLERGFETENLAFVSESDILGDRLLQKSRSARRAGNFLREAAALSKDDLVVHVNHGVGRFDGLETIEVSGSAHDCLRLLYKDGDKLYLPVENIEMLSRFGGAGETTMLDRLGGTHWQARHARLKKRLKEMAGHLIKTAARRQLRSAPILKPPEGIYDEFAARFPYAETEDQRRAIGDVLADLASDRPMDRLICGDVGFGKTEVALRAAFVAALNGLQVAIVAPTTLLALQHFQNFRDRFSGLPVRIEQLSRLVPQSRARKIKDDLINGQVDIVIGTHALLAKSVAFRSLGLVVVDEEQHFGVAHKERLKQLRSDAHVLTLTATPIPRTLQMAMSGLRDLSIIATPPIDRLAVRTFVLPFDELIVREALLREHFRGGQSFFVCPRVADLPAVARFLSEQIPEIRFVIAHGQLPVRDMEGAMTAFYEGRYDVLLSTSIIESGLDIPSANTLIIHRADMFGLAQLYQIRGRVGRAKSRAYAYLTVPANRPLTEGSEKRLKVLQSLDSLGAGFTLASHDLDIRGAGNLLGQEQSGHIREVGIELYQQMLEKAVADAQGGETLASPHDDWSPQLNLGLTVMIPERYVANLNLRMALYRRLGDLVSGEEIEAFGAELVDRFGPLPEEVEHLLAVIRVKAACRTAGIARLEAGAKGARINFKNDRFANPAGLVDFISTAGAKAKLRPDHTLVYLARWDRPDERIKGARNLARLLAKIAGKAVTGRELQTS
jgi:transcription-repair coupling factor (superfamily II helicase)